MKKLDDFQAEQVGLKSIIGGIGGPAQIKIGDLYGTMVERPYAADPSCCQQMTDSFNDHNDNGIWDHYPSAGAEPGGGTSTWKTICDN